MKLTQFALSTLLMGLSLSGLLPSSSAHAELNSAKRVRAFAALPDWTGLWEADNKRANEGTAGFAKGYADPALLTLAAKPPYNAEWEARVAASFKDPNVRDDLKRCSFGFPSMMDGPAMFQVMVTPEETLILFHGDDVRHVYTDGRSHPAKDDLWPTPVGDSVGHWEGQTLIIDTIARKAGPVHIDPHYVISEQAHFTERVRMLDKNSLEDRLTIEDPIAFSKPWTVTLRYKRVTDIDRVLYQDCNENDRNPVVNGELIIAPPQP